MNHSRILKIESLLFGEAMKPIIVIKKKVDPEFLFNCHHCVGACVGYED